MARSFGHEDAGLATEESLVTIIRNQSISSFLDTHDKRYLVGPKGSGKTLILLRKAIDEREKGAAIYIPSDRNRPVDRLDAAEHVGQKFHYTMSENPTECQLAWTAIWKHSILRSVLHHLRDVILTEVGGAAYKSQIERLLPRKSPKPLRPFYYYTDVTHQLDSSPREELSKVREELVELDILLQHVTREVHVFLDNLDDYYELQPDLWKHSMYGQFRAVREISQAYRHIHISTSIRQDVYSQFDDEMRLQYYDYVSELRYTTDNLIEIFATRIQHLDADLLCRPSLREKDPWLAFFGELVELRNDFLNVTERIESYIYRHTLGRPRDMIHMGTVLLNYRPSNGFDAESVRAAVSKAGQDICKQYIAETGPLLDESGFYIRDFVGKHVPSNILAPEDVAETAHRFLELRGLRHSEIASTDLARPFETLYDLGLLGIAKRKDGTREVEQCFLPPSQGNRDRILPSSSRYFLHPVLNYLVPQEIKSDTMIVGPGLPVAGR